jgi:dienelactone hydrolase
MSAVKKPVDIEIYDAAGHAFESPANMSGYRPEATADAWLRTLKFFGQT